MPGGKRPSKRGGGHSHHHRSLTPRGWFRFLTLRILHENPTHGYQLVEEMEARGYISPGQIETRSIYVTLNRMEERGLLSSTRVVTESGRLRRIYSLTSSGIDRLKMELEDMIRKKGIREELEKYYIEQFQNDLRINREGVKSR